MLKRAVTIGVLLVVGLLLLGAGSPNENPTSEIVSELTIETDAGTLTVIWGTAPDDGNPFGFDLSNGPDYGPIVLPQLPQEVLDLLPPLVLQQVAGGATQTNWSCSLWTGTPYRSGPSAKGAHRHILRRVNGVEDQTLRLNPRRGDGRMKKLVSIIVVLAVAVTAIVGIIGTLAGVGTAQDVDPGLPYNDNGTWTPEYFPVSDSEGNRVGVVKSADTFGEDSVHPHPV